MWGNIRDESGHIADARHQACDHVPAKGAAMNCAGLVYNRTHTVSLDYAPDEECNACDRYDNRLDGEQVAAVYMISLATGGQKRR